MNLCYAAARGRSIGLVLLIVLAGAAARAGDRGIVCVLVPHFKDEYWLTVGWGLEQEAADTGLALRMHEAGGYRARDAQIAQIDACVADGAAAILLGAVSADHPDLLAAVARAASRVPVFGLVNALEAPGLAGRVGVDWREMGAAVGRELAARYPPGGVAAQAVLVSGPAESGWAGPLEAGLRDGLGDSALRIVAVLSADTGLREQFASTAAAFAAHPDMDVLIGSAPAIEAAMGHLRAHPGLRPPLLAATYVTHSVRRGLASGQVAMAPFDDPQAQGRMALQMVAQYLAGGVAQGRLGPPIRLIRGGDGPAVAGITLSPADYFPRIE